MLPLSRRHIAGAGFEKSTAASSAALTPEEELILAVYRRARQDLIYCVGRWQADAERFFKLDGFDPDTIRRAWEGKRLTRQSQAARERRCFIRRRRDDGMMFKDIARDLGLTPERVRQIYYAK